MLSSLFSLSLKNAFSPTLLLETCAKNYPEFSRFYLSGQQYRLEDTKSNALDISDFRNEVHYRMVLVGRWQIHLHRY